MIELEPIVITDERAPIDRTDWLDDQEFFERCLNFRHALGPVSTGNTPAFERFEELKKFIREMIGAEIAMAMVPPSKTDVAGSIKR